MKDLLSVDDPLRLLAHEKSSKGNKVDPRPCRLPLGIIVLQLVPEFEGKTSDVEDTKGEGILSISNENPFSAPILSMVVPGSNDLQTLEADTLLDHCPRGIFPLEFPRVLLLCPLLVSLENG